MFYIQQLLNIESKKMNNLFLSVLSASIAIFFIYLSYSIIKRWSKLLRSTFGDLLKIIFLIILIPSVLLLIYSTDAHFYDYWEKDRVHELTEFNKVKLGWSKEELLFRFGKPIDSYIQEKGYGGYRTETLRFADDKSISVSLKENKVVAIDKSCTENLYDYLGGIACSDSLETLIRKYGNPNTLEVSHDNLSRYYNYPRYNLTYELNNGKVVSMLIVDKKYYPEGRKFPTEADLIEFISQIKADEEKKWKVVSEAPVNDKVKKEISKKKITSDFEPIAIADHCSPGSTRKERMESLALKGSIRETGYHKFEAGNSKIIFADSISGDVITCY